MTWLFGFLASRGIPKWAFWVVIVAVVLGIAWGIERADDKANQSIGAAAVQRDAATGVIIQAEKANAAAENIKRDPVDGRDECLQNARNPEDC